MDIEASLRAKKLNTLLKHEGYVSFNDFLNTRGLDSVCPGICLDPDCNSVINVEGDQEMGWCPECNTNTVAALLVLADAI